MKYTNAHKSFADLMGKLVTKNFNQQYSLDMNIPKKLLSFFQVGDYYYYVFNVKDTDFDYVSPEVEQVLRVQPQMHSVASFMSCIHPDDVPWFLNFENKVVEFFTSLRPDQVTKYKVRYDYRVKKANGENIRILQQVITLQFDEESGLLLRTFGIHTDITHLKKDGKPVLSIIGLDGEPSYLDINVKKIFTASDTIISQREKEVLQLLIEGKRSNKIGSELKISTETVNKHRKNMLRKTNTASTAELVAMAVTKG